MFHDSEAAASAAEGARPPADPVKLTHASGKHAAPLIWEDVSSKIASHTLNPRLFVLWLDQAPALKRYEAISLFLLRAQAVRPDLALDETTVAAISEICRRLDGLPLALELAAARLRLLSPAGLLARLVHPLHLLNGGARDLPERQQKLRATVDWSYALLDPSTQALFRRLAVFAGGWTADAAEAVCTVVGDAEDALSDVGTLLDNSLVQQSAHQGAVGDEPRFRMLEIIREYGVDRLVEHGEAQVAREAHARYFRRLVAHIAPELRGNRQAQSLAALDVEYGNLRAAFEWLLVEPAWNDALQLAVDLWYYWVRRERLNDGCGWLGGHLSAQRGRTARSRGAHAPRSAICSFAGASWCRRRPPAMMLSHASRRLATNGARHLLRWCSRTLQITEARLSAPSISMSRAWPVFAQPGMRSG